MRIVIVGAGIAGLVTAAAAHRAGHVVTLLERAPRGTVAGAGISLFGNGLRALDTIASNELARSGGPVPASAATVDRTLADRLREIGGTPRPGTSVGLQTPAGRWLARTEVVDRGRLSTRGGDAVDGLVVHRADLQRLLDEQLPAGIAEYDSTVLQVEDHPATVAVTWTGPAGEQTAEAELVVAADGINSRLRRSLFGDDPGVSYAGYTSWRGVTATPVAIDAAGETWGRGKRFGIAPLRDGRVYWFATASLPAGTAFSDERAEVLRRFAGWHSPIQALVQATPPDAVLHHDINELAAPLRSFTRGRVVLVGDSAHAMTPDLGQGGGQAMEDAVTLVALLDGVDPADGPALIAALQAYDRLRRGRTQPMAIQARRLGRVGQWSHRPAVATRNAVIRLLPSSVILGASTKLQDWSPPPGR